LTVLHVPSWLDSVIFGQQRDQKGGAHGLKEAAEQARFQAALERRGNNFKGLKDLFPESQGQMQPRPKSSLDCIICAKLGSSLARRAGHMASTKRLIRHVLALPQSGCLIVVLPNVDRFVPHTRRINFRFHLFQATNLTQAHCTMHARLTPDSRGVLSSLPSARYHFCERPQVTLGAKPLRTFIGERSKKQGSLACCICYGRP